VDIGIELCDQIFKRLDCCCGFPQNKLKENDLKYWFPIIELMLIFTQINIFIKIYSKPILLEINSQIEKSKKKGSMPLLLLLNYYWNEVYGFMLKH
jgi:hypothetical protein